MTSKCPFVSAGCGRPRDCDQYHDRKLPLRQHAIGVDVIAAILSFSRSAPSSLLPYLSTLALKDLVACEWAAFQGYVLPLPEANVAFPQAASLRGRQSAVYVLVPPAPRLAPAGSCFGIEQDDEPTKDRR